MGRLRGFGRFCYDFVVGDDWTVAAAMVVAIAITAALAHHGIPAWWTMPLAVAASLTWTVVRGSRHT